MPRSHRDSLVGVTLGARFRITRPLAEGGMARVYVARDEQTDKRIALKVLTPHGNADQRAVLLRRMELEVVALERLEHPDIVKTIGHGSTDDGGFFIAMELIEGPNLSEWARQVKPRPEESIQILLQICSALRHAHRKGVVHRDVKAANILIAQEPGGLERAKLIDFGVVKLDDEETLSNDGDTMLGSVHTMAPEAVRGDPIDHRADMYAVGILAFRLLAGRYPYHSRIAAEVISRHVHAPIPLLEVEGLPRDLASIVARCMAKKPEDRFKDMPELMDELAECLDVPTAIFTRAITTQGGNAGELLDEIEPRAPVAIWAAFGISAVLVALAAIYFFSAAA